MTKRVLYIAALTLTVATLAGIVALAVLMHNSAQAGATPSHHGMSPALWVAIFTGVWVPLLAGASRRRRNKKDGGNTQP